MVRAVDGVDLAIDRGETLGVVGESGCGKTVTAMTVLKLIQMPPGRIVAGSILWQGRDLVPLGADEMRRIRSKEIAIIFQEPMTSLNPVYTVGEQIAEAIRLHEDLNRRDAMDRAVEMLRLVHIPTPGAPGARLSAPVLRRHAPARDDRDGAVLQSQAADRRRADHGARRHHPGADPRSAGRDEVALRHGDHADHPRHGRGRRDRAARGGDVCRPGGRGGAGRAAVRQSAASLHAGPDPLDPAHRQGRRQADAAGGDRRHGAQPDRPAARLPLRAALQVRAMPACTEAMPELRTVEAGHKVACILY